LLLSHTGDPFLLQGFPLFYQPQPRGRLPFIAGLIISNLAGLVMFVALYRLVWEDFGQARAYRTVLYLAVFPTAFFFAAAYNEAIFLCLSVFSFYFMRRNRWWLAGLFGFLASLTRSAGLLLFLPFCYEYLRQQNFQLKKIRFDIISSLLIPVDTGVFALYCYFRFHDLLAFSHAQAGWTRALHGPWHGLIDSFLVIVHRNMLNFDAIHNVIDLGATVLMLLLTALCFVGPWKMSREFWVYGFYAVLLMFFFLRLVLFLFNRSHGWY
jgi:Gpi18-like mannosyltransferase